MNRTATADFEQQLTLKTTNKFVSPVIRLDAASTMFAYKNNIGTYPQSLLEKSLRKGKIKLNKKKTNSSYKLKIGDEISFYNFNYEFKNIKTNKYTPSKKI